MYIQLYLYILGTEGKEAILTKIESCSVIKVQNADGK